MKNIKQLLNTTIPKNFIYYNNKASIKIQLPTTLSEFLIQYLDDNKIKYTLTTPEYIIYQFRFISNFTQIHIKK
jgi:hypothetical protein